MSSTSGGSGMSSQEGDLVIGSMRGAAASMAWDMLQDKWLPADRESSQQLGGGSGEEPQSKQWEKSLGEAEGSKTFPGRNRVQRRRADSAPCGSAVTLCAVHAVHARCGGVARILRGTCTTKLAWLPCLIMCSFLVVYKCVMHDKNRSH
jgi:hypothetical protein